MKYALDHLLQLHKKPKNQKFLREPIQEIALGQVWTWPGLKTIYDRKYLFFIL